MVSGVDPVLPARHHRDRAPRQGRLVGAHIDASGEAGDDGKPRLPEPPGQTLGEGTASG